MTTPTRRTTTRRTHNPAFCECLVPDPCRCGRCACECFTCGRMVYRAVLEDVYAEGTEHRGPYHYGDGGYAVDRPTVPAGTWVTSAHP